MKEPETVPKAYGKLGPSSELYQAPDPKKVKCRACIVGTYYRTPSEKDTMYRAQVGAMLTLIRDKANTFDRNAVKCMLNGRHVGYLSQSDAALYGKAMDLLGEGYMVATLRTNNDKYPTIEFEMDTEAVLKVQVKMAQSDFQ